MLALAGNQFDDIRALMATPHALERVPRDASGKDLAAGSAKPGGTLVCKPSLQDLTRAGVGLKVTVATVEASGRSEQLGAWDLRSTNKEDQIVFYALCAAQPDVHTKLVAVDGSFRRIAELESAVQKYRRELASAERELQLYGAGVGLQLLSKVSAAESHDTGDAKRTRSGDAEAGGGGKRTKETAGDELLKLGHGLVRKSKFMTAMRDEWLRSKAAPALPKRFAKFTWANVARGCGLNSTSMSNEVKQMFQMLTKCDDPQLYFGGENSAGDGQDDTSDDGLE